MTAKIILQIVLLGIALSMDAFAVSVTDGLTYTDINKKKSFFIAGVFGFMQALMPLIGFWLVEAVSIIVGESGGATPPKKNPQQHTTKPKPQKAKAKEVPLAAPSVLEDDDEALTGAEDNGGEQVNAFGGGNIQTDFANFPYPWYITQVRNSLWSEWEKRRPAGSTLGALVSFAIARDGKVRDLKVEKKSGDDTFDFAATSAVINAGPFAPLPMYYEKDELTVTVEFKQES